jgi:hypothetical protein
MVPFGELEGKAGLLSLEAGGALGTGTTTEAIMEREGGCACGAVRYVAEGGPLRVGLCHCLTCRKRHGAPFNAFAAFPSDGCGSRAGRRSGPAPSTA